MDKEFINLQIKPKNTNTIKLENQDDLDDDPTDNTCGVAVEEIIPKIKKIINKKICNKCKKNKSNYFTRNEFVCKECLFDSLDHKFRSNLRVQCKIRHEDTVLVCISGSNNSMAMLHWFNTTFNDNKSKRKLFFKLKILYVDDSFLNKEYRDNLEYIRKEKKEFLTDLCNKYKFPLEVINLEHVLDIPMLDNDESDNKEIDLTKIDSDLIEKYLKLLSFIPTMGSFYSDFNRIMTRNLIFHYALNNKFTKIILGNNALALVTNIFSNIIKGRGFSVKEAISHKDEHYLKGKIIILRPMKDILNNEVLLYNHFNNIDIFYPDLSVYDKKTKTNMPLKGNTERLIGQFFEKLQVKYYY
jgi:tRNA(Ile)-lysidine synthase TilS/MesJ